MCADGPLLPPLSSPTTVDTVATAVTTHHHATAAVAHNFARCYILSSRPVITIPSSPSRHHHHRPPVEPTCWGLTPESLRPDATFILELIVTEQTSAQ